MGLPNINIAFTTTAAASINQSSKGVVALILKDSTHNGELSLTDATKIPSDLSAENKTYIAQAFLGYVNVPRKVIAYVLPTDAADLTDALNFMATQTFDYLVGPPDCTEEEAAAIATWIKSMRQNNYTYKAVLPNTAADSEGIINFTGDEIKVGNNTYSTSEYCSRIAGLIAGTPMTISCTYASLPEVSDVKRLTNEELDNAIDDGQLVLLWDGEKVETGRGVNSMKTTTSDKGEAFKKIKIVEAVDMIQSDIRKTAQDSYIGKYPNNYDSKCLLLTAIRGYFDTLVTENILSDYSVDFDETAIKNYLESNGTDVSKMTSQEIRKANTGSKVFLTGYVSILDAMEDITLNLNI
ncbi:MAG: Phage tail sheath protein [Oscillospiraceae bacterium]|jgi:hypothetical protein